ncbi:MAG: imidazole glycerol phosphate synthase subunit HisF [Alphaproteobacteria bacterium]|nr:imidazole glycerol phosphate synthase subunit HisF [Alphaproteobacteria bacterium]
MPFPRLIPCLLLKNGLLMRSQLFKVHQVIGNPMSTVERFSSWNVDELVILDISAEDRHDLRRDDLAHRYDGSTALDVLKAIARVCCMPLAFGGRIRSLDDISARLEAGADKVVINSQALKSPQFIANAARRFGSQCIVVSIDAKRAADGSYEAFSDSGVCPSGKTASAWAREVENLGAGEILLNSIDRDGSGLGYDLDLVRSVTESVAIPVIALGGVGNYGHFALGVKDGGASAVSAANIFHFFELSYPLAKQSCIDAGIPMRRVSLNSRWFPREPVFDVQAENARLEKRMARARAIQSDGPDADPFPPSHDARPKASWCTKCTYPYLSAAPMEMDDQGVCMGCRMSEVKQAIPMSEWNRRRDLLKEIVEQARCRDGSRHDCVIAVSGGKDSYFQAHVLKNEFGLNPLLVTYNGNNYTPVGWRNLHRMKEAFGLDHVIYAPNVDALKKLNRLSFKVMGDMNWHAHAGITTIPVRIAAQNKIPLVFWGEHGYLDLCGQFSMNDFPEMSYRDRLEHFARSYEWNYFEGREGLTSQDLIPWKYPSDQELFDLNMRGIYLGNYVYWEANNHTDMVIERYGFEVSDEPFDRTYRRMSNLDDMHENGIHDYLKFIKFGYGRCTDHTSKDLRAGLMDRTKALELVMSYDPVKPRDLARWLQYVGMSEAEFDAIADTFRDPRVWWREGGKWVKHDIIEQG